MPQRLEQELWTRNSWLWSLCQTVILACPPRYASVGFGRGNGEQGSIEYGLSGKGDGGRSALRALGDWFMAAGGLSHGAPSSWRSTPLCGAGGTPGHERPKRVDSKIPGGMDAWVFMAPRCWPLPFPTFKPNPGHRYLSIGRGDYAKRRTLSYSSVAFSYYLL